MSVLDPEALTNRVFLIGAGFSKPAGLPLANELLDHIRTVSRDYLRAPDGFSHLEGDLHRYEQYLADTDPTRPFDLEEFGAWLDWENVLRLRGSDTWSRDGNKSSLQLRWAIGHVLHTSTPTALPKVYLEFARRLTTSDTVLTLNYDLLLERALGQVGVPFRRFPQRFESIGEYSSVVDMTHPAELRLHKLHGSLDWVRIPLSLPDTTLETTPLVDGPRRHDDPLAAVGVIATSGLAEYYGSRDSWYRAPPLVLAPSTAKPLHGSPLVPLWEGLLQNASLSGTLAVIGCSLPTGDPYVRQVAHNYATQIGASLQDQNALPWPQTQMKVVDYRQDRVGVAELHSRFRFMPRAHTDFVVDGFSLATLDDILPSRDG